MSEFFNGVMQWEFDWQGSKAKLPVFYQDVTTLNAIYTARSSSVGALLPDQAMHLIELRPGRCLVAITCFEYRRSDIDAYNEVSISFPIRMHERPIPGLTLALQAARRHFSAFVWQLPVTTERARLGGVGLYGYPKFLADIVFTRARDSIRCELSVGGDKILALDGPVLPTRQGKPTRYVTYPVKDGITLGANVLQNPIEFGQTARTSRVRLELGATHAIARTMRELELSERPILYEFIPVNEAILFAGRNLMDD